MLTLPIEKKWFDMILSGEKREEYRGYTNYYFGRFEHALDSAQPIFVIFRNGYRADSPYIQALVRVGVGYGLPEWGAEPGKKYYVLNILVIVSVYKGAEE